MVYDKLKDDLKTKGFVDSCLGWEIGNRENAFVFYDNKISCECKESVFKRDKCT